MFHLAILLDRKNGEQVFIGKEKKVSGKKSKKTKTGNSLFWKDCSVASFPIRTKEESNQIRSKEQLPCNYNIGGK